MPPPEIPDHKLLKRIGRGSYGEVWLARNVMGTYQAVKIVRLETFPDAVPFEREFNGICNFEPISRSQRNQLQVLHVGRKMDPDYFYYVMELADPWKGEVEARGAIGQPAKRVVDPTDYVPYTLQQRIKAKGRLPFADCLEIILALAEALNHLHKNNLIHRDIKPANIIFVEGVPKLADIGLVTSSDATMSCPGAEGFTAPEGTGRPPADIYSLGKVLYEMCTGADRMSFPSLPAGFDSWSDRSQVMEMLSISLKACEPNISDRYASVDALIEDLILLQAGKSVMRFIMLEKLLRRIRYISLIVIIAIAAGFAFFQMRHNLQKAQILAQSEQDKRKEAQKLIQQRKLLESIQYTRMLPRFAGWFERSWNELDAASQIKADEDVRDHGAALLAGIDATAHFCATNFGASSILFDRQGKRIIATDAGEPARILNASDGAVEKASTEGLNTVAFWQNSIAVHASLDQATQIITVSEINASPNEYAHLNLADAADGGPGKVIPEIVQLAPDGTVLAAILQLPDNSRKIAIWSTADNRLIFQRSVSATRIAFSPDSSVLAISLQNGSILIHPLDMLDSPDLTIISGQKNVLSLAMSPIRRNPKNNGVLEGKLAIGDGNGTIGLWDLEEGIHVGTCFGGFKVDAVSFSPDGTIVAGGGSEPVRLWDAATGRLLLHLHTGYGTKGIQFSPDGQKVAVAANHGYSPPNIQVWDLQYGHGVDLLYGLSRRVEKIAFSPDSETLAAISHLWELAIWDLPSKQLLHKIRVPPGISVDNCSFAFSPDNEQLAFCAGKNGMVWKRKTGSLIDSWELRPGLRDCLTFNSQGQILIFRTENVHSMLAPKLYLRDPLRRAWIRPELDLPPYDDMYGSILVDSGKLLLIDGSHHSNLESVREMTAYETSAGQVKWSVKVSDAGTFSNLVDAHNGSVVSKFSVKPPFVIDLMTGAVKQHLSEAPACFSPSGILSASCGRDDRGLQISLPFEDRQLVTLGMDHSLVAAFASFDSKGNLVAAGDRDGTVMVCNLTNINARLSRLNLGWKVTQQNPKTR